MLLPSITGWFRGLEKNTTKKDGQERLNTDRHTSCLNGEYCPYCDAIQLGLLEEFEHEEMANRFTVHNGLSAKVDSFGRSLIDGVSRVFRKKENR